MQSSFWCAARLMSRREAFATHFLGLAGFEVYLPRLRESRTIPPAMLARADRVIE